MNLQLSYDVIINGFWKSTNDTVDINQDSTDEDKVKEDEVILDKLTLAKHHVVFKLTPFDNELRKSNFIVTSKNLAKVASGRLANMAICTIKIESIRISSFCYCS